MAAIVHSDKAKKAIKKVKDVMKDYPMGIEFGELMQKSGYAKTSLYNALSMVGASKSADGLWHLPGSQNVVAPVNDVAEDDLDDDLDDLATAIEQPVTQDDGGNMQDKPVNTQDDGGNIQDTPVNMQDDGGNTQDEELNTQAPKVSYPDNDEATHISLVDNEPVLVDNNDILVDIDTDADQSNNGRANLFWSKDKVYCPMFGGEIFELEINTSHTGSAYPNAISGIGFTRDGKWNTTGAVMLYHANEENYQMLCQKYPELDFEVPMFAGSYLCIKQLKKGKKFIICAVSDLSDATAIERLSDGDNNIKVITGYDKSSRYFTDVNGLLHTFAVPLSDDTGEPIYGADILGAA